MIKLRWVGWYALALVIVYGIMPGISYALAIVIEKLLGLERFGAPETNFLFGLPILLFGVAWMGWSTSTLRAYGKGHAIHAFGKAPQPTKRLCNVGPYKYAQNPMYFGWLTVMVGLGVMLGSIAFIFFVPVAWVIFIYFYLPRYEWPELKRRFGDEWLAWHRNTPVILPSLWKRWNAENNSLETVAGATQAGQPSVGLSPNKT